MTKEKLDKKKLEEAIKDEEAIKEIKADPRTKEAIGGITEFLKVCCPKCGRRLKLAMFKLAFLNEKKIKKWVDNKICEDCKKFLV